jgi:hypothetical protein
LSCWLFVLHNSSFFQNCNIELLLLYTLIYNCVLVSYHAKWLIMISLVTKNNFYAWALPLALSIVIYLHSCHYRYLSCTLAAILIFPWKWLNAPWPFNVPVHSRRTSIYHSSFHSMKKWANFVVKCSYGVLCLRHFLMVGILTSSLIIILQQYSMLSFDCIVVWFIQIILVTMLPILWTFWSACYFWSSADYFL